MKLTSEVGSGKTLNPQKPDQKYHYGCTEVEHPGEMEERLIQKYQILHNL